MGDRPRACHACGSQVAQVGAAVELVRERAVTPAPQHPRSEVENAADRARAVGRARRARAKITWQLVGTAAGFEYWQLAGDIYRRRETSHNWHGVDGTPSGVRWEGSRAWFDQWIAPGLASNPERCGNA